MTDIIVEVRGGCVVAIHSRNENVKAEVLDWDDYADTQDEAKEAVRRKRRLGKEIKEMVTVW